MLRAEIEHEVVRVLRQSAFIPEERDIDLSDPLGQLGVADSLAVVEFVTAVEVQFQTELPDTIWTAREEMTLQRIVDAVAATKGLKRPAVPKNAAEPVDEPSDSELADSRIAKAILAVRERGVINGGVWALSRFANLAKRTVYYREDQLLLEFDLRNARLPSHQPSIDITIRKAIETDFPTLIEFFSSFRADVDRQALEDRLHSGFTCFVAIHEDGVVGMTWNSDRGEQNCPFTGLNFEMLPGSCYALDLHEHESYTGKGVGLALLAHALVRAKEEGYTKQVTSVDVRNTKMLAASIHMSGFVKIGTIRTRWVFRRPLSTWETVGNAGRGGTLVM